MNIYIYICLDAALLVQTHRFYTEGKNSTCLLTEAELNVNSKLVLRGRIYAEKSSFLF